MQEFNFIFYIFIGNFIITFIYFIAKFIKKDVKFGCMMSIFMLLCPVIAPCYLFFSWIFYRIFFKRNEGKINIEELSFRKDKIETISLADINAGLNKVPIEEALLISDKQTTRNVLLDVLKNDHEYSLGLIAAAIDHKDSEVSHYAASAITDIIAEFKVGEKQYEEKYKKDKNNKKIMVEYRDYLSKFLLQNILPKEEQKFYVNIYENLVIFMEKEFPMEMTGKNYEEMINILLELREQDKVQVWVEKVLINRTDDLEAYKAGLKFYYAIGEGDKFLSLLEQLKHSNIVLDNQTLELVRVFNKPIEKNYST